MSTTTVGSSAAPLAPSAVIMRSAPPEVREVIRCEHPNCKLTQFRPANGLCRKCGQPLSSPAIEKPLAVPQDEDDKTPAGVISKPSTAVDHYDQLVVGLPRAAKRLRDARHLSQLQLSWRMTVPRTWISKIETGKNFPKLASLELLALGLRVSIFDFVSLAMAPPSEFDRILEGILWQEELLRYFCRANRADRAFFCDFAGSLIDPARAVARERAAAK